MKTIKHWLETLTVSLFLAFAAFGMAGCDTDEDVGDELEDAADEVGDAAEEAADEIEDAVE
jgi:predicted small secreted protein